MLERRLKKRGEMKKKVVESFSENVTGRTLIEPEISPLFPILTLNLQS